MAEQLSTAFVCPVVVGRAGELSHLLAFLEGRDRPVLLLAGEAGIGKTRLVVEGKARARQLGQMVFQGSCFEPDRALPYGPLLDLLRPLVAGPVLERTGIDATTELGALFPELAGLARAGEGSLPPEPEQHKRRVFYALTDLLLGATRAAPALVVVEDLHWSDDTSLEYLVHLARRAWGTPLRVLLSYRSDEPHPSLSHVVAELQRERLARELVLRPLASDDVRAMARAILATAQPPRELLDALDRLAEGNPFFVEEVLASLVAADDARTRGDPARPVAGALPVPRTVRDAIQRRVLRLSEPAREVLTLAAVAGRRFDFALLRELTGRDEAQLLDLIKELARQHLVVEESADRFAFRHALTREAIYVDLFARERRALHQAIGEALERLDGDARDARASDLAYHFFQAGDWARTFAYSGEAGERALNRYAPRAAIDHLTQAMTAADRLSVGVPARLYRRRGQAYEILGEFDRAVADFTRALGLTQIAADPGAEWQARLDLAQIWSSRDYVRTGEYIRQAREIARSRGDPALLAHTLNRLGNWHSNREELADALACHREALALFEQLGDRRGVAETLDVLGMTETIGADLAAAAATWERAIPLLRALDDRPRLVFDLTNAVLMAGFSWSDTVVPAPIDQDLTMRAGREALAIAREIGFPAGEAYVLYELALWHGPRGEYARALELARAGLAVAEEIEHREWIVGARCALGALHLDLLDDAAARDHAERAVAMAREIASSIWLRLGASVLAAVHLQAGEHARASAVLDRAIDAATPPDTLPARRCWCVRGELALATGDARGALEIADRLIATAPGGATGHVAPRVGQLRGEALGAVGRLDEAEDALRAARDEAARWSLRPAVWRLDLALGRLYQRQGRRLLAQRSYAAARSTIEELAAGLPDEAPRAAFLREARARLPAPRPPSAQRRAKETFGGLTARERDVAGLIAAGKSNRAIAAELVIGERTVEGYVSNILGKLGFASRAQIAGWAVARGLAPPRR